MGGLFGRMFGGGGSGGGRQPAEDSGRSGPSQVTDQDRAILVWYEI